MHNLKGDITDISVEPHPLQACRSLSRIFKKRVFDDLPCLLLSLQVLHCHWQAQPVFWLEAFLKEAGIHPDDDNTTLSEENRSMEDFLIYIKKKKKRITINILGPSNTDKSFK